MSRRSQATSLTAKGWDRLRSAVEENLGHLQGLPIDKAVDELLKLNVPCNETLLRNLSKDLHVWRDPIHASNEEVPE